MSGQKRVVRKGLQTQDFLALIIPVVVLLAYLPNIAPTVTGGDSGDFLTAIFLKTSPHPPGFPLYTLFGILFSFLPLPVSFAWKIGLLSALTMAGAVSVFYFTARHLVRNTFVAVTTSLTFGLLYPVWLYAVSVEVFAISVLFFVLLFYLCLLYLERRDRWILYLLLFSTGLALSAHQITLLILPSLFYFIYIVGLRKIFQQNTIVFATLSFFLGLLPYLFVLIAGRFDAVQKWGSIHTFRDFYHFVLRLDYGWTPKIAVDTSDRITALLIYSDYWWSQLPFLVTILSVVGLINSMRRYTKKFLGLFLAFFFTGPFFILYAAFIPQSDALFGAIERFYLLSGVFILFFFAYGLTAVLELIHLLASRFLRSRQMVSHILFFVGSAFLLLPLSLYAENRERTNLREVQIGEQFVRNTLFELPSQSLVITSSDTFSLNAFFVKYVVMNGEGPVLLSSLPLNRYIKERSVLLQERERLLDTNPTLTVTQANTLSLLRSDSERDIFSEMPLFENDGRFGRYVWVPYGTVFKLRRLEVEDVTVDEYIASQERIWKTSSLTHSGVLSLSPRQTLILSELPRKYARQLIFTARFVRDHYKAPDKAVPFYEKALIAFPNAVEAYEELGSYYLSGKNCSKASQYFSAVSQLDPTATTPDEELGKICAGE